MFYCVAVTWSYRCRMIICVKWLNNGYCHRCINQPCVCSRYIEEHVQRTGVAIETQGFTFITSGRKRESLTVSINDVSCYFSVIIADMSAYSPLFFVSVCESLLQCMCWWKVALVSTDSLQCQCHQLVGSHQHWCHQNVSCAGSATDNVSVTFSSRCY